MNTTSSVAIFGIAAVLSWIGAMVCQKIPERRLASEILAVGFKAVGWLCAATAVIILLVILTGQTTRP